MSKIEDLRKKHQKEIENLQKKCKHKKVTDWLDEYWAPGHSSFRQVKICNECGKTTKARKTKIVTSKITTISVSNSNEQLHTK